MNDDLPVVRPRTVGGVLPAGDLRSLLAGVEPGWYTTADLLPRVNAWLEREGRARVSAKTLGEAIRRELRPERRHGHNHVAMWNLTSEHVRAD